MRLKKLLATTSLAAFIIFSPAATHFASAASSETTVAAEGATEEVATEEKPAEGDHSSESGVKISHAAHECIELLEKGGPIDNCQKAPNPILPPVSELVWGTLAFLIVFAGLAKFALPAMGKTLAARSAKIEGDLNAAAKAKTDAEAEGASYRAKVGDAKAEGDKILDDARAQAEIVRRDVLARAEADAAEIRRKATEESAASSTRLKGELEGHVKRLSVDLAEKVVGANLNRETNAALVDKYIAELAK
jgi:F-type H+-transporting ATPase subunit b